MIRHTLLSLGLCLSLAATAGRASAVATAHCSCAVTSPTGNPTYYVSHGGSVDVTLTGDCEFWVTGASPNSTAGFSYEASVTVGPVGPSVQGHTSSTTDSNGDTKHYVPVVTGTYPFGGGVYTAYGACSLTVDSSHDQSNANAQSGFSVIER